MKDNQRIVMDLLDIAVNPEQVLFLKNLDLNLMAEKEAARQQAIIELSTTKSVYRDVIQTIVGSISNGY
jgi:hypothetical protein